MEAIKNSEHPIVLCEPAETWDKKESDKVIMIIDWETGLGSFQLHTITLNLSNEPSVVTKRTFFFATDAISCISH